MWCSQPLILRPRLLRSVAAHGTLHRKPQDTQLLLEPDDPLVTRLDSREDRECPAFLVLPSTHAVSWEGRLSYVLGEVEKSAIASVYVDSCLRSTRTHNTLDEI